MSEITWFDVKAIAPELGSVDLGSLTAQHILAHVHATVPVEPFGGESSPRLRMARMLLAAHYGRIATSGGALPAGPVTAESMGGLSRSYAAPTMAGAAGLWSATTYGQQYAAMLQSSSLRLPRVA